MLKTLKRSPALHRAAGRAVAGYLKFVRATSRIVTDPPDLQAAYQPLWPVIVALWHGEHMMSPFLRREGQDVRVMVSRSADGELAAAIATAFGFGVVRGAGDPTGKSARKGGARAMLSLIRALEEGASVALTADVPKVGRVVGPGIVTLARISGRPIIPLAVAAHRRYRLEKAWDKLAVALPFNRIAIAAGDPITIPPGQDEEAIERGRERLASALDRALADAYRLADGGTP